MSVTGEKQRALCMNRNEKRRARNQFLVIEVARVYPRRRARDAARNVRRRDTDAAKEWMQRNLDPSASARHPLLVKGMILIFA